MRTLVELPVSTPRIAQPVRLWLIAAEFYQVIADTAGPQTDQTPENIILQCEDFLFDELIKHGKAKDFDDNGSDPCNDIDVKYVPKI
jgi:hypothetical protein